MTDRLAFHGRMVAVALGAALALIGCGHGDPSGNGSGEGPGQAQPAVTGVLQPRPAPQRLGSGSVTAEPCRADVVFRGASPGEVFRDIEIVGSEVYVDYWNGTVARFVLQGGAGCTLSLDKRFGSGGSLTVDLPIVALSRDNAGRIAMSMRPDRTDFYDSLGQRLFSCTGAGLGIVRLHPTEGYGLAPQPNGTISKVTYDNGGCRVEPWPMRMTEGWVGIDAVGFSEQTVFVGGPQSWKVLNRTPRVFIAFTRDANGWYETFRNGHLQPDAASDGFGTIDAVEACGGGTCALDTTLARISVWQVSRHTGNVPLPELLGLNGVVVKRLRRAADGSHYLVAAADHGDGTGEGLVYRVRGL